MKQHLFGQTLAQLTEITAEAGMPRFAAGQIATWLYAKHVTEIDAMSNISMRHRAALAERYDVGRTAPIRQSTSKDGTKKYLYEVSGGHFIESAYIPDGDRATLCVSSEVGCKMGCKFCATGKQGFQQSLTAGEILNQAASLPERDRLTNMVYMGMGEPLDNTDEVLRSIEILTSPWGYGWSPTRITLSTVGVAPQLERFLTESKAHLAVSLHNPFPEERAEIMPAERMWSIEQIIDIIRRHDFSHQRRVSFEYIVLEGSNHSPRHVAGLAKLLNGLSCRINLIRFHKVPGSPFVSPDMRHVEQFQNALKAKGFNVTIRASRGEDIEAACGLLSTKELLKKSEPDGNRK